MNNFNNGPFFFLPFPASGKVYEDEGADLMVEKEIFDGANSLRYGNAFKNQYLPYKNYQPYIPVDKTNEMLLQIQMYGALIHDLNLYLDVYPKDKEVYLLFKKNNEEYLKLIDKYQEINSPLLVNYASYDGQFTWVKKGGTD